MPALGVDRSIFGVPEGFASRAAVRASVGGAVPELSVMPMRSGVHLHVETAEPALCRACCRQRCAAAVLSGRSPVGLHVSLRW